MKPSLLTGMIAAALMTASCGPTDQQPAPESEIEGGQALVLPHARTFSISARDGYHIVDMRSALPTWGGAAQGPEQHARLVLVPRGSATPELTGDLAGAQIVRTPVMRIATNYGSMEAALTALGIDDRLVAVGGLKSYNDSIRERTRSGSIRQIGYGWHSPPNLDTLVASRPDVLLMAMASLEHTQQMERIRAMGIPVLPVFIDNEPHYMGSVDYMTLLGLLTGREQQAASHITMVAANVARIRERLRGVEPVTVMSAWYNGGDRWMGTVRGGDAMLLRDAGGRNLLAEAEDPRRDNYQRISTETLLQRGREAACWIWRDTHSQLPPDPALLRQFRAVREGCLFASDGMTKPQHDAFDYYERAAIRPDLELADMARMLHPRLFTADWTYIRPDRQRVAQ
jgi:iron complex transport system substrate-binding protein